MQNKRKFENFIWEKGEEVMPFTNEKNGEHQRWVINVDFVCVCTHAYYIWYNYKVCPIGPQGWTFKCKTYN